MLICNVIPSLSWLYSSLLFNIIFKFLVSISRLTLLKVPASSFFIGMPYLFPRDFPLSCFDALKCSTITLFYLKFGFLYCNKYYEVLFEFIGFEEYLKIYKMLRKVIKFVL
jgi:hypothetical protein